MVFLQDLLNFLNDKGISNALIIMDNCSIHLTEGVQKFYRDNALKIKAIVPYASQMNGVELLFIFIK